MNESNLWDWLRDVALPIGHYSRIEAPDTAPGFPDVHYCFEGNTGTMELKYARHVDPPFPDEDTGLHRSQITWIRQQIKNKGQVWIVAEIANKNIDIILCIDGAYAALFNGASLDRLIEAASFKLYRKDPRTAVHKLEAMFREHLNRR